MVQLQSCYFSAAWQALSCICALVNVTMNDLTRRCSRRIALAFRPFDGRGEVHERSSPGRQARPRLNATLGTEKKDEDN